MKNQMQRPKLVTVLGLLNIFDCLASILFLIFIFLISENGTTQTSMHGIFFIAVFASLSAIVGVGMLTGQKWSWYAEFVLIGIVVYQTAGDYITYITGTDLIQFEVGRLSPFEVILTFALCSFIIVYLNTKMIKKYFKIKT